MMLDMRTLQNGRDKTLIMRNFSKIWYVALSILLGGAIASCSPAPETETETKTVAETQSSSSKQTDKPNIVFILVDDMGFGDVGYNGSEIATPNLDKMAQSGTVLDRNYVYPICSPTRAALLTGRSPLEFGIDAPINNNASLPPDTKIMPEYFSDLGYQTALVGKWHLGLGQKSCLLYTSPSPRDRTRSRMPSSA